MGHEVEEELFLRYKHFNLRRERAKIFMNKQKRKKKIYGTRFLKNLDILIYIQLRRDNREEE